MEVVNNKNDCNEMMDQATTAISTSNDIYDNKLTENSSASHYPMEMDPLKFNKKESYESTEYSKSDNDDNTNYLEEGNNFSSSSSPTTSLFSLSIEEKTNLFRWENIAIPWCYLTVGLCQGLSSTFLNVYPLEIGATEAQQTTIAILTTMPATCKILFGFVSDNYPIGKYRRKPYMLIGWIVSMISIIQLILVLNNEKIITTPTIGTASSISDFDTGNNDTRTSSNSAIINTLSCCFLSFAIGFWCADVMGDTIVAERVRYEPEGSTGKLQSTCYASRFLGIMVSAPFSTYCYSVYGPMSVLYLLALTPLPMMPLIYLLREDDCRSIIQPTKVQLLEIWKTICKRSVWYPFGFIFIFNVVQVSNLAWRQFLHDVLLFTTTDLNLILVVSNACIFVGIMMYKFFFLSASWRNVFLFSIILNGILSVLQLLLILNIPRKLGISNFWFALGDDAAATIIEGIHFLPFVMLSMALCPKGSEGASYAMFTTANNCAILLAPTISSMLLPIWDVSAEALNNGQLEGLFNLSVLTTIIQTIPPLFILHWVPHSKRELFELAMKPLQKHHARLGGILFLLIIVLSILYSVVVNVLNIVDPGWAGES